MSRGLLVYALVSLSVLALVAWSCIYLLAAMHASWPGGRSDYLLYFIALSPPVLSHSFLLFPETVMFAVSCLAVACAMDTSKRGPRFGRLVLLAIALGCAPWLHRKFSPYALGLAASCWWMRREQCRALTPRRQATLLGLLLVPHVLLYGWTWYSWGTLVGPQFIRGQRLDVANIPMGLLGLFADREAGLLAYAPVYLVLPASLLLAVPECWPLMVAVACLVLPMSAFDEWWGGFCPAARYLVPTVPIFAVCLARSMRHRRIRTFVLAFGALQIVLDAILWRRPRLLWPQNTGANPLFAHLGRVGHLLQEALPAVRLGPTSTSVALLLVFLSALTYVLAFQPAGSGHPSQ